MHWKIEKLQTPDIYLFYKLRVNENQIRKMIFKQIILKKDKILNAIFLKIYESQFLNPLVSSKKSRVSFKTFVLTSFV